MKARVHITLKNGVLDPQGKAIENALGGLGFSGISEVRQGKYIEIVLANVSPAAAEHLSSRCVKSCWPTPVIENYEIDLEA